TYPPRRSAAFVRTAAASACTTRPESAPKRWPSTGRACRQSRHTSPRAPRRRWPNTSSVRKAGSDTRSNVRSRSLQTSCSAHRFLHECADSCLVVGGQLRQREGDWPHCAFVELRRVVEPERRVPRLELLRAL